MFTVGFVQFCPVRCHVARNIEVLETLLRGVRADLLVLPELANSGYLYAGPADLAPYAESSDGHGPFLSALVKLAGLTGGLIVSGFAEASAGGLFNSAATVDRAGLLQVYRKTHLFKDEQDLFLPGDTGFHVLAAGGVRLGTMVCFDWFFPEAARTLALRGAQIIAHPSNLVMPWCQQAMVTRSLENSVFTITANRYGTETLGETSLTFTGGSQMLDTQGQRLLEAPSEGDCVAICTVEPHKAEDKAINPRNDWLLNRRPEMYL